ncbi:MAG: hypothetical protein AB7J28_07130 [Hyphomonadaceae bacterium]
MRVAVLKQAPLHVRARQWPPFNWPFLRWIDFALALALALWCL